MNHTRTAKLTCRVFALSAALLSGRHAFAQSLMVKLEVHVMRICGGERIGILSANPSPATAAREFQQFVAKAGVHVVELDNLV